MFTVFSAFGVTEVWNGVVHVSDNSQFETQFVELNGLWEFYPSQEFQTFNREQYDMAFIKVPGSWKVTAKKNFQCDIACYRLKIMGLKPDTRYAIFSRKCPATASKFFCNGHKVAEYGTFSANPKVAKPCDTPVYAYLDSDKIGTIELVVQISSYSNHESGITVPIIFSEESVITSHFQKFIIIVAIIAGFLLFNCIINFAVYIGSKDNKMYLIFTFLFLGLLISSVTINGCLLTWICPSLSYSLIICFEFIPFWLAPQLSSVLLFYDEKFQAKNPYLDRIIFGLFSAFGLVFCAFPIKYTNYLKTVLLIFNIIFYFYIWFRSGRLFAEKNYKLGGLLVFYIVLFTGYYLDMIFINVIAKSVILFSDITLLIIAIINESYMALTHQKYYHQSNKAMINFEKIYEEYEKFISKDVLKVIYKDNPELVKRGDFSKFNTTIMYIQMTVTNDDNTTILPRTEFETCSIYISEITKCVIENGGFISNYLGRGCVALFEKPDNSLFAARAIIQKINELNEARRANGLFYVKFGAGIHTGDVVIGTIGEDERLDNAVVGYGMNVVFRISSVAFNEQVEFLVSEKTVDVIEGLKGCDLNLYEHSIDTPELNVVRLYRCFNRDDMLRLNPQNVKPEVLSIRDTDKFVKVLW